MLAEKHKTQSAKEVEPNSTMISATKKKSRKEKKDGIPWCKDYQCKRRVGSFQELAWTWIWEGDQPPDGVYANPPKPKPALSSSNIYQ